MTVDRESMMGAQCGNCNSRARLSTELLCPVAESQEGPCYSQVLGSPDGDVPLTIA